MELLLVGLAWVLVGRSVTGGAAVILEYQASGSLMIRSSTAFGSS